MDPMTLMLLLGIGGSLIGGGVKAYGEYQQGQEASEALLQNAQAAESDAAVADIAAGDAIQRGQREAGRARTEGTKVIGEQKVALGASGVDVSTGSPLALMADTRVMSELDAQTIRNNAAREAWGIRTESDKTRRQAKQYRTQAERAESAGGWAAAGTILGSGASAAAQGYGAYQLYQPKVK